MPSPDARGCFRSFRTRLGLPAARGLRFHMLSLLRAIGIFNAAIWLGSSLFFAFIVAPTLLAAPMKTNLGPFWAGFATQAIMEKLMDTNPQKKSCASTYWALSSINPWYTPI